MVASGTPTYGFPRGQSEQRRQDLRLLLVLLGIILFGLTVIGVAFGVT